MAGIDRREPGHSEPGGSIASKVERRIAALYASLDRNRLTRVPWAVIQTFSKAQGALLSGSMAYYTFLSVLPLLLVATFLVGLLSSWSPEIRAALVDAVEQVFPGVRGREVLRQLIETRTAFGIFAIIALAYGGGGFVGALTACLNRMWGVRTGRNPLGQKALNIGVVLLLGIVLLGSVAVSIWVAYVTRIAFGTASPLVPRIVELLAGPLSLFIVLLLVYRLLPARELSWRSQVPGAALGAVGIDLLKRGFTLWTQHSAGVGALPRSLVSAVLLLVWLGFFGQLILYGAALNVVRERMRNGLPPNPGAEGADTP